MGGRELGTARKLDENDVAYEIGVTLGARNFYGYQRNRFQDGKGNVYSINGDAIVGDVNKKRDARLGRKISKKVLQSISV